MKLTEDTITDIPNKFFITYFANKHNKYITRKGQWFRWHDSGDIQSPEHLIKIFEVCKRTPGTQHWMPTREVKFLTLMDPDIVPSNLIIRISSHMINQGPVKHWPWTSTVSTKPEDRTCAAPDQDNECKDCRV